MLKYVFHQITNSFLCLKVAQSQSPSTTKLPTAYSTESASSSLQPKSSTSFEASSVTQPTTVTYSLASDTVTVTTSIPATALISTSTKGIASESSTNYFSQQATSESETTKESSTNPLSTEASSERQTTDLYSTKFPFSLDTISVTDTTKNDEHPSSSYLTSPISSSKEIKMSESSTDYSSPIPTFEPETTERVPIEATSVTKTTRTDEHKSSTIPYQNHTYSTLLLTSQLENTKQASTNPSSKVASSEAQTKVNDGYTYTSSYLSTGFNSSHISPSTKEMTTSNSESDNL